MVVTSDSSNDYYLNRRDQSGLHEIDDLIVSWSTRGDGFFFFFMRTVHGSLNHTLAAYKRYKSNSTTVVKRDTYNSYGNTWLSFNTYVRDGGRLCK